MDLKVIRTKSKI
jgi:hypothetical protein